MKKIKHLLILVILFLFSTHTMAGNCGLFYKSGEKFLSGIANVATGFVEIPKGIVFFENQVPGNSLFLDRLGAGLSNAIARTAGGVLDFITFPIPTNPSINPTFIWEDFSRETSYQFFQPCKNTYPANLMTLPKSDVTEIGINQTNSDGNLRLLKIGDIFSGGIIFYIDETGLHGLIAALTDQSPGPKDYSYPNKLVGATENGVGAGAKNTAIMLAAFKDRDFFAETIAKEIVDYRVDESGTKCVESSNASLCFGDWYVPSSHELNLMYTNLHQKGLGNFAATYYTSSTEYDSLGNSDGVWYQNFRTGFQFINRFWGPFSPIPQSYSSRHSVRLIRAF